VANRGEVARRILRTAHEMGLGTVAVFSDADASAPHVRDADVAVRLPGVSPADTYLNVAALLDAARAVGADAVHPGYGFLAESASFAEAVIAAGLTWVGPPPSVIAAMGDKIGAKRLAEQAGLPVAPSADIEGDDPVVWASAADRVGWPLLVKAAAGGGGKGMRLVTGPAELSEAVAGARREAGSAFGDSTVFLERFVVGARHVEVQVAADRHGRRVHLHERDCSVQRRHQKVIEEAPAPGLSDVVRSRLLAAALDLAAAVDYSSLGTVEFLVEGTGDAASIYFLEMNTRLQVEHPVTEAVTGVDLVRLQFGIAMGRPLPLAQADVGVSGHAIEARVYAEDPALGYLPQIGTLHRFDVDTSVPGVRCDSGVESGSVVTSDYDALLAKVVVHAPTRDEAVGVLSRTLSTAAIHGITTNRGLLVAVLGDPDFHAGAVTTDFLPHHLDLVAAAPDLDAVVGHAVAVALGGQHERRSRALVQAGVPSGWRNVLAGPCRTSLILGDHAVEVAYRVATDGSFVAAVTGVRSQPVEVRGRLRAQEPPRRDSSPGRVDLVVDLEVAGVRRRTRVTDHGDHTWWTDGANAHLRFVEQRPFAGVDADLTAGGPTAPVPGTVTEVMVSVGDSVVAGQPLVVLEAMKMEHRVLADTDAVVREVCVVTGEAVEAHQELVVLDPVLED